MASTKYTHAVVCRIPQSYRTKCDVQLDEAKRQHEALVKLLRELGLDVIELPPDENLPECIFVEDTAIVCNGTALITRPGVQSRLKEVSRFWFLTVLFIDFERNDSKLVEISFIFPNGQPLALLALLAWKVIIQQVVWIYNKLICSAITLFESNFFYAFTLIVGVEAQRVFQDYCIRVCVKFWDSSNRGPTIFFSAIRDFKSDQPF